MENKNIISKSKFKPRALHYFREVEKTGKELIISDRGKPVLKIVPFSENTEKILKSLRNTMVKYENPTDPVGLDEWESLK
jgi:prevent-host-death family protein